MMAPETNGTDDFFEENRIGPVQAATGGKAASVTKKKAGFYLSIQLLERFNRKFFELKLAGCPIENKSALVEAALKFALDDLDRLDEARVALKDTGALAVGISGSGPTVFALVDDYDVANRTAAWLDQHYRKNDNGFVHICRADLGGARCID